jgi:(S)-ureidoglycine---glyoxylate transaminase
MASLEYHPLARSNRFTSGLCASTFCATDRVKLTSMAKLDPPRRLLMGSGPSNAEARVLRAMARPPLPSHHPEYAAVLDDLTCDLRKVFCASSAIALVVPGASRSGIEAVLNSLVEPGDRVLVAVYGHFGELLCTLASRHGADVERVDAEWGHIVDPAAVSVALRKTRPKVVAVVHADTSTGTLQPLDEIGRACRDTGSLLVVDAVLSIGGCEVNVDAWGLDAVVGGMQKCLGGPPGLAPLVYSTRAAKAMAARTTPAYSRYLDLRRLHEAWQRPGESEMATPMLYALREALRRVDEEGSSARWQRHAQAAASLRTGLQAMGLELFGDRRHAVPMITLVKVPDGIDEAAVRAQMLEEHGVEIMAAFGPLRGKVWRIGTMGTNATLPMVLQVLAALEAVLSGRGFSLPRGAGVDAALAARSS